MESAENVCKAYRKDEQREEVVDPPPPGSSVSSQPSRCHPLQTIRVALGLGPRPKRTLNRTMEQEPDPKKNVLVGGISDAVVRAA